MSASKVPSLLAIIEDCEKDVMRTGQRLGEAMVKRGQQNIARNTPVETRHLRDSLKDTPVVYKQVPTLGYVSIKWSAYAWTGEVYTEVEYAPFVELGTGLWGPKRKKYKIAPKKPGGVLAFTPYSRGANGSVILDIHGTVAKGGTVFVRYVMHPGSPGAHMFKIGTMLTEHEVAQWADEPLRMFKTAVETRFSKASVA